MESTFVTITRTRPEYIARDHIDQILAQLSLSDIDNQYPIRFAVVTSPGSYEERISLEDFGVRHLERILGEYGLPLSTRVRRVFDYPSEQPVIVGEIAPPYLGKETTVPSKGLKTLDLEPGYVGNMFDITQQISKDTTQGTVYKVDVFPNASLHTVTLKQTKQVPEQVPAILKKTPIYDEKLWKSYVALQNACQAYDPTQESPFSKAKVRAQISSYTRSEDFSDYADTMEFYCRAARRVSQKLTDEYDDIENPAYVDAVGYYLGSLLSEYGVTPFFPLFYASFRAFDGGFFGSRPVFKLGQAVNRDFPVEVVVMQPLHGTAANLVDAGFFYNIPGDESSGWDVEKIFSMTAQVVFGLDAGQEVFGIVNNDFHGNNLMYEDVPYDTVLYYQNPTTREYWRVPTFGKVYKMIDFGYASFDFGGVKFRSPARSIILGGGMDLYSKNNDLYEFAGWLSTEMDIYEYLVPESEPPPQELEELVLMLTSIMDCNGANIYTKLDECDDLDNFPELRNALERTYSFVNPERCADYVYDKWFFEPESKCTRAVPKDNLHWFSRFAVPEYLTEEADQIYIVF
jgi:hypothetical protein